MKKTVILFVLFFIVLSGRSQSFAWAVSANGNGIDEGIAVCNDQAGNVIMAGQYTSSVLTLGSNTITNSAGSTVFVAKYSPAGNLIWVRKSISTAVDFGNSIATDGAGNIIVTGFFQSATIIFGTYTLTNTGDYDIFIVKYDANGNVVWAQSAGGPGNDYGYSTKADVNGNVYVAGSFGCATLVFGSYTLTNTGASDSYVVKFNPGGVAQWAHNPTGSIGDENWSVCPDANGNVYVAGDYISPTIIFGSYTVTNPGVSSIYLAKYDANGNVQWVQTTGGSSFDLNNWVEVDKDNNVLITGDFSSSSLAFGTYTLTNSGSTDMFLVKYDPAGTVIWAQAGSTPGIDKGFCVTSDDNYVYACGTFTGTIVFGGYTLTAPANSPDPVFITTYDYNGNVLCAEYLKSGGDDQTGISADKLGNAYIASDFINMLVVGSTTLTPTGTENIYLAKYMCGEIIINNIAETKNSSPVIFPNPVNGSLEIVLENKIENSELVVFNSQGRKIIEQPLVSGENRIKVEQYANGVYNYFILQNRKEIHRGKLVFE